ncbi:aminopeptidase N [Nocardioides sp. GY 10127]|uniref:aminopeptidase N n=1 Tax=Nocardioides sp. GY 10127 TaxID=2569762 RepID=UPI0010A9482F|nr:aminopeptidase N [Nocardioides sp. GY 10127]TIC86441.1 aminopeptidase N [Nocardioides sp. GY 10127]
MPSDASPAPSTTTAPSPAPARPRSLRRAEAVDRAALLEVESYDLTLDLTTSEETFDSLTRLVVASTGGETFLDLRPTALRSVHLDGVPLDTALLERGRFPLSLPEGRHEVVVDAVMPFRHDGEGLHRAIDPADGRAYVYGMSFMDAAPTVFACFDQPDLKAPYTLHVRAPREWTVIGNGAATQVEPGTWELATTQPLSTYFVTLVAGPYHVVRDAHDGIPLGLSARASLARALEDDAEELFTTTAQCFDELHRLFGIRYPFGEYHQAFVPEFNAGAMENPGCVTFRDTLVFSSRTTRGMRTQRAITVAHEMAHQWFGNLVTPRWWDDLWLNESFAEYMGNRVTASVTQFDEAWVLNSFQRRQWGLLADQRPTTHSVAGNGADDALEALQSFDGISYAKGSAILRQLNARLGDDVFMAGAVDHFTRHRFGNATMHDLLGSWERAGAADLGSFSDAWLTTAGPDLLEVDRGAGLLRRTPPVGRPADRAHTVRLLTGPASGPHTLTTVTVDAAEVAVPLPAVEEQQVVVLDAAEETWAATLPDPASVALLPALVAGTDDARLRAAVWNQVRSGVHHALVDPDAAVDLAEAWLPVETVDAGLVYTFPWVLSYLPHTSDPAAGADRLAAAALTATRAAEPGSPLQLAAFQAAVGATRDPDVLAAWVAGTDLPDGVDVDLELRWRLLVRLATLGATDRAALDAALEAEPTAVSRVEHTRAVASLPTPEAKVFAWDRLTGAVEVPNYELTAAGEGMWRAGQESVTDAYVARFAEVVPDLPGVHAGWVLASAVEAFFPRSSVTASTVDTMTTLAAREDVDASVRRRLVDATDELVHRLGVRRTFRGV